MFPKSSGIQPVDLLKKEFCHACFLRNFQKIIIIPTVDHLCCEQLLSIGKIWAAKLRIWSILTFSHWRQHLSWKTRFLYKNRIFFKHIELLREGQLHPVTVPPFAKDLRNANYFYKFRKNRRCIQNPVKYLRWNVFRK